MTLTTKQQVIVLAVSIAGGVAVGRFTVPVKIKTEIKTVEVEKKTDSTKSKLAKKEHKQTTIVKVKKPDGTVTTTTQVTDDINTGKDVSMNTVVNDKKDQDTKKEVKKDSGRTSISALIGVNPFNPLSQPGITYGGMISRDVLGPFSINVFGFNNGMVGGGIGISF